MYLNQREFGERVKALRNERNLTQKQMAYALRINIDHYGRIEQGKRGISVDLLLDMAEVLDVSIDYLVKGTSHPSLKSIVLIAQMRELLDRFEASGGDPT